MYADKRRLEEGGMDGGERPGFPGLPGRPGIPDRPGLPFKPLFFVNYRGSDIRITYVNTISAR